MVASEVLESTRRRFSFLPASMAVRLRRASVEVMYERCAGLDVHKKSITACVLWALPKGKKKPEKRRFATFTQDLLAMADWLRECGVTHVAMESTGVYWKPVGNILEGQFEILLVNAQHIKAVPGRKTDQKDSEWIADLLQHGLLKGSFVPPTAVRELRDLTVPGESGAGVQPHRQPRAEGAGGCQYQAGVGSYRCVGCIRPRHVGCHG